MMTMRRTSLAIVAFVALAAGCSSGSDETLSADATATPGSATTEAPVQLADDPSPADESDSGSDDTVPETTDASPASQPLLVEGGPPIELLTSPAPVGSQPEMAWSAVDGAATYRVVVLDGDGAPYWAWSGPETTVFLGGGESGDGAGPSVGAGFTWSVTAFDADRAFLASSPIGALSS